MRQKMRAPSASLLVIPQSPRSVAIRGLLLEHLGIEVRAGKKRSRAPTSRPAEQLRRRSVRLVLRRAEKDLARFRIVLTRRRGLNVGENLQSALYGGARR